MQVCFAKGEGGGGLVLKVIITITLRSWHLVFFVSPPLCSLDSVKKTTSWWNCCKLKRGHVQTLRRVSAQVFWGGLRGTLKHEPWRFPKTVRRISSRTFQHQEFIWSTEWANFGQHRSPAAKKNKPKPWDGRTHSGPKAPQHEAHLLKKGTGQRWNLISRCVWETHPFIYWLKTDNRLKTKAGGERQII